MNKQLLFLVAIFLYSMVSYGGTFVFEGNNYSTTGSATVEVTSNPSFTGADAMPARVTNGGNTCQVEGIGDLTSISIPDSVINIEATAFYSEVFLFEGINYRVIDPGIVEVSSMSNNDLSFSGVVTIPAKFTFEGTPYQVEVIGVDAFRGAEGLTSISIPDTVTSIGDSAFYGCISLTSVIIPGSIISVGDTVFSECTGLTSVIIPDSVTSITSIGDAVFSGCIGLTSMYVGHLIPLTPNRSVFRSAPIENVTLYVPAGKVSAYMEVNVWKDFKSINEAPAATHLNFDGVDDGVTFFNHTVSSSLSNSTALTIETWVKPALSNYPLAGAIVSNHSSRTQFALRALGTGYEFFIGQGLSVVYSPAGSLTQGVWQHVAAVYNGTTIKLYIDGVLAETTLGVISSLPTSADSVYLGSDGYGEYFNGGIDEVRIWKRELLVAEIQNNMNCELATPAAQSELLAYYKLNQGISNVDNTAVTSVIDSSVSANHGILTNLALTGTTSNWVDGSAITTGSICGTLSDGEFVDETSVKMFPNPTNAFVSIDVPNLVNAKLQVLDITGKILINQELKNNSNSINIENLSNGIYLFKIKTPTSEVIKRIIKN